MTIDLLPAIYAALKAEPGLTPTGLARRLPFSRKAIIAVVTQAETDGYLMSQLEEMGEGYSGPPRRYFLHPNPSLKGADVSP